MKKRFASVLFVLISVLALTGSASADTLFQICVEKGCGYIDKSGQMVIQPKFDSGWGFSEGLAVAYHNKKYGYIDKTGRWAIQAKFDSGSSCYFKEGLACAQLNDKWGYINKTGEWVISPKFKASNDFQEGLVALELNGKLGYIDKTGQVVIQPKYYTVDNFQEGIAHVWTSNKGDSHYIDKTERIIAKPDTQCGIGVLVNGNGDVTWAPNNFAQACKNYYAEQNPPKKEYSSPPPSTTDYDAIERQCRALKAVCDSQCEGLTNDDGGFTHSSTRGRCQSKCNEAYYYCTKK